MDQTTEPTPRTDPNVIAKKALMDKAAESLIGFDAVVILATYVDKDGTAYEARYSGNHFAVSGLLREVVAKRDRRFAIEEP
jgi:hypothetical protein